MNAGSIWWGQIGNSLRLLRKVTNNLKDCRSAVLQVPKAFPWRQDFYEAVDIRRAEFCGERRLVRLPWVDGIEPGELVLDELCSSKVRADYWPGQSYAEYLGSNGDILLCDYYVWITGIQDKGDLARWAAFISQYEYHAELLDHHAVFILEYTGVPADISGIEKIVYTVESYDCRVFCLEAAATLANSELRAYQAELALCIGGDNPEFCAALLMAGDAFLCDPVKTTMGLASEGTSSDGTPFACMTEVQISSAAWEAEIILLFPILERFRMDFVTKHQLELVRHLPITNSNGDQITDPFDLEIGSIYYIVSSMSKAFTADDIEDIQLCRKIRNLLAHNRPVPYVDVKRILSPG